MRHFLILACLLFGTGAAADEADFDFKSKKANIAIEKYQATIKKAKAVEKRNRVDLILALEAALKYERTEGELDEAIKIRDAIKALKKGSPAGGLAAGSVKKNTKTILPDGIYLTDFGNMERSREDRKKGNSIVRIGDRLDNGSYEATNVAGRLRQIGNNLFEIKYENGDYYRWWVYEKHILVEAWDRQFPRQQYERAWYTAVINRETGYRKK